MGDVVASRLLATQRPFSASRHAPYTREPFIDSTDTRAISGQAAPEVRMRATAGTTGTPWRTGEAETAKEVPVVGLRARE